MWLDSNLNLFIVLFLNLHTQGGRDCCPCCCCYFVCEAQKQSRAKTKTSAGCGGCHRVKSACLCLCRAEQRRGAATETHAAAPNTGAVTTPLSQKHLSLVKWNKKNLIKTISKHSLISFFVSNGFMSNIFTTLRSKFFDSFSFRCSFY